MRLLYSVLRKLFNRNDELFGTTFFLEMSQTLDDFNSQILWTCTQSFLYRVICHIRRQSLIYTADII